jgi:hypothetical protein
MFDELEELSRQDPMSTVNRRLTNLEIATREQNTPEHGLSRTEVLDRIYD